ncbi:MAG: M56 family metallopeptidase [Caulobacteraceae bacterium]
MTGLLLDHLWQSTLFAAAAGLLALALHANAARVRFWVWFAAAAKFLAPFVLITSASAWLAAHLHAQTPAPVRLDLAQAVLAPMTAAGPAHVLAPLAPAPADLRLLGLAWVLGSVAILSWRAVQWLSLRKALAGASPLPLPSPLPAVAAQARGGPAVVGFLRPMLVLPRGLTERLTPAELEAVLEHELHHARRADNLLALPLLMAQALFWFHPLIWGIGRRMLAERERACDEAVVQSGIDAETYARGLLEVCRLQIEPSPAFAAGMTGANLKLRIRRIMSDRTARPLGGAGWGLLATGVSAALAAPVLGGVFVAPAAAARLLASLPRPVLAAAVVGPVPAPAHSRPADASPRKIVLSAQETVLTAQSEPRPNAEAVSLTRRLAAPMFDAVRPETSEPEAAFAAAAPAHLMRALALKTDYMMQASLWGDRLELRTAGAGRACPTAQVVRAEAAFGGEAISTAFDGQVGRFVEDALAGRPAPARPVPRHGPHGGVPVAAAATGSGQGVRPRGPSPPAGRGHRHARHLSRAPGRPGLLCPGGGQ